MIESKCKVCARRAVLKDVREVKGVFFRYYECESGHEVIVKSKKRRDRR